MTADRGVPRRWAATRINVERADFLRTGEVATGVRAEIAASWRRSVTLQGAPESVEVLAACPRRVRPGPGPTDMAPGLVGLARRVNELDRPQADTAQLVVVVTDADGVIVARQVAVEHARTATDLGLFPGQALTEAAVGTNAVATARATGRVTEVRGAEHLLPEWIGWNSAAGPVRDVDGGVLGFLGAFERATGSVAMLPWLRLAIALVQLELRRLP